MKKFFSFLAAALFAGSMMAAPYNWDGRGHGSAEGAVEVGGKAAGIYFQTAKEPHNNDYNTNSNMIAGAAQKGNWTIKINKGFKETATEVYYMGITLDEPIAAGDTIKIAAFRTGTNSCVFGMDFNADSLSQSQTTQVLFEDNLQILSSNGVPVDTAFVVPAGAVGAQYLRLYRKSGSTGLYIAHFEVAHAAAPVTINYWLVGTAAENGWDQTAAMPMPGDSIVRHLAAGTYEFKVLTQEASWTGALGYANLNAEASSANVFGDSNVAFELENEGDATIKVVDGQIVVLGTFKEQVQADYYIKFAGNGWTWVGMGQAPSGVYMYEGVWGGVGANLNTSMSDEGATWYPEADIFFGTEEMETLPVPAVGTVGYYVYIPDAEPTPMFCFLYEGTPSAWDGTVTLSKDTITSLADLEGITLTYNGAMVLTLPHEMESSIALQNEDGSELYALWAPVYGGTYVITDTVVTLNGWYTNYDFMVPLPAESAIVYFEDYGSFVADGVEEVFFETVQLYFDANPAPAVTYNVNLTVNGIVEGETAVGTSWCTPDYETSGLLVAGDNTVNEGNYIQISVTTLEGYETELKVNGEVVAMEYVLAGMQYWKDTLSSDLTIVLTITAPTPAINYWLVGTAAENGWDQNNAMPMESDQIVRHLAAGTYEFKVLTQEASWTGALGASAVNAELSSPNWYGTDNVCFELENEGDVTIAVVEGQIVLTGTFKEQVSYDYYIKYAGNGWTWVGMELDESNYVHAGIWGGTGANVNTVQGDAGAQWFPEANINFVNVLGEAAPVAAVGTEGYYVYMPESATLYFSYEYTPTPCSKTIAEVAADVAAVADNFYGDVPEMGHISLSAAVAAFGGNIQEVINSVFTSIEETAEGVFVLSSMIPEIPAATVTYVDGAIVSIELLDVVFVHEEPTGLMNIKDAKAIKFIENGKVVILRGGVRYNANGQKL